MMTESNWKKMSDVHGKMSAEEKSKYRRLKFELWRLAGSMLGKFDRAKNDRMNALTKEVSEFEDKMIEKHGF